MIQIEMMMERGMESIRGRSPGWEQLSFDHASFLDLAIIQLQDVNVLKGTHGVM